jgi:hypothetical protein
MIKNISLQSYKISEKKIWATTPKSLKNPHSPHKIGNNMH